MKTCKIKRRKNESRVINLNTHCNHSTKVPQYLHQHKNITPPLQKQTVYTKLPQSFSGHVQVNQEDVRTDRQEEAIGKRSYVPHHLGGEIEVEGTEEHR